MTEATEPKIYPTDEQWAFVEDQEKRRTAAANQVHREGMRLMAAQATCMNLQETRRMEEKRDFFAATALSGMLSSETDASTYATDAVADRAYRIADAMLSARSPSSPPTE